MSQVRLERLLRLLELEEKAEAESRASDSEPAAAARFLSISWRDMSPEGLTLVGFEPQDGRPLPPDLFEPGDMVRILSEKGDSRFRPQHAVVWESGPDEIVVSVSPEALKSADPAEPLRAEQSADAVTYRRMREAVEQAMAAPTDSVRALRGILEGERKPDPARSLVPIHPVDSRLNPDQILAVQKILSQPVLSALHGPPGTGKTAVLAEVAAQLTRQSQSAYFAAPSNGAADALVHAMVRIGVTCVRIGHPARMDARIRGLTVRGLCLKHSDAKELRAMDQDKIRLRRKLREAFRAGGPDRTAGIREAKENLYRLADDQKRLERNITDEVIGSVGIYVGTLSGVMDPVMRNRRFDTVVIDEASQALEPAAWMPMLRADRVVLAGDPHQLPATLFSDEAVRGGLGESPLERALRLLPEESRVFLPVQYRMNEAIGRFPSEEFYGGRLVPDLSVRDQRLSGLAGVRSTEETDRPLEFIDTAGRGFEEQMSGQSFRNSGEAVIIEREVARLIAAGVSPDAIGVISPYSAQRRLLSQKLALHGGIEVDTVDGFQGREKECIFVSCVRSNFKGEWGFLTDPRRLNVAWTRARRKLVVIGDSAVLAGLPVFGRWMSYVENAGVYRSAWEWDDAV